MPVAEHSMYVRMLNHALSEGFCLSGDQRAGTDQSERRHRGLC
jgi:hypothetical protein